MVIANLNIAKLPRTQVAPSTLDPWCSRERRAGRWGRAWKEYDRKWAVQCNPTAPCSSCRLAQTEIGTCQTGQTSTMNRPAPTCLSWPWWLLLMSPYATGLGLQKYVWSQFNNKYLSSHRVWNPELLYPKRGASILNDPIFPTKSGCSERIASEIPRACVKSLLGQDYLGEVQRLHLRGRFGP